MNHGRQQATDDGRLGEGAVSKVRRCKGAKVQWENPLPGGVGVGFLNDYKTSGLQDFRTARQQDFKTPRHFKR